MSCNGGKECALSALPSVDPWWESVFETESVSYVVLCIKNCLKLLVNLFG